MTKPRSLKIPDEAVSFILYRGDGFGTYITITINRQLSIEKREGNHVIQQIPLGDAAEHNVELLQDRLNQLHAFIETFLAGE